MNVGLLLQQAREAAGLSVEEVSERTRIRSQVIRDLEAGKLQSSGGVAYARGHIRSISRVVGADAEVLVSQFNSEVEDSNSPMIDLLAENSATPLKNEKPKLSYKKLSAIGVGVLILVLLIPVIGSHLHSKKSTAAPATTPSATPVATSVATPSTSSSATPTATPSAEASASATPSTPPVSASSVAFTAVNANSWLSVTDKSGTVLWHGMLFKGASQKFTLSGLINVTIGNAGAVDVTINGKDAGLAGKLGEVVNIQYGPGATS